MDIFILNLPLGQNVNCCTLSDLILRNTYLMLMGNIIFDLFLKEKTLLRQLKMDVCVISSAVVSRGVLQIHFNQLWKIP